MLMCSAISSMLAFGVPTAAVFAQQTTVTEDAKKAGKETKKTGKHAARASKHAAQATGKSAKSAAKKTARREKSRSGGEGRCDPGYHHGGVQGWNDAVG